MTNRIAVDVTGLLCSRLVIVSRLRGGTVVATAILLDVGAVALIVAINLDIDIDTGASAVVAGSLAVNRCGWNQKGESQYEMKRFHRFYLGCATRENSTENGPTPKNVGPFWPSS
ncbi:hypothetical protein [Thiobaca trueperi]|uniref:hypothetical protein n=1 Tax=Thiobaca trueperi TaxID=127458 RepID=UPI00104A76A9|nr:hypothetical protein [Thiobaca trueperi]